MKRLLQISLALREGGLLPCEIATRVDCTSIHCVAQIQQLRGQGVGALGVHGNEKKHPPSTAEPQCRRHWGPNDPCLAALEQPSKELQQPGTSSACWMNRLVMFWKALLLGSARHLRQLSDFNHEHRQLAHGVGGKIVRNARGVAAKRGNSQIRARAYTAVQAGDRTSSKQEDSRISAIGQTSHKLHVNEQDNGSRTPSLFSSCLQIWIDQNHSNIQQNKQQSHESKALILFVLSSLKIPICKQRIERTRVCQQDGRSNTLISAKYENLPLRRK